MVAKLFLGLLVVAGTISPVRTSLTPPGQTPTAQGPVQTGVQVRVLSPESDLQKNALVVLALAELQNKGHVSPGGPRVVCGMKVWRVDPNLDPGIHKQLSEPALDAKIQHITPPACRRETAANQVHTSTGIFVVDLVGPPKR